MNTLDGKVALITGAARGQGRAHAVKLASEAADIIAIDVCQQIASVPYPMASPDDLIETAQLVKDAGRRIYAAHTDVRDSEALSESVRSGVESLGRLDFVVANAAIAPMRAKDAWTDVIDVNLTGVFNTVEASAPMMVEQATGGSIVLISSTGGLAGMGTDAAGSIG